MSTALGLGCTSLMQTTQVAFIYPTTACPTGMVFAGPNAGDCKPPVAIQISKDSEKSNGTSPKAAQCTTGNPCNAATGNKVQVEVDFAGGDGIPSFVRTYNLFITEDLDDIGIGWRHNHGMRLELKAGRVIRAHRADGQILTYSKPVLDWITDGDVNLQLTQDALGYSLALPDGSVERYALTGLLSTVTDVRGWVTTYGYNGNQLNTITGPFGHRLSIAWYNSEIRKLTTPDNQNIFYTVPASGNLTVVTNADATTRQYLYEDVNYPHALTGIVDESGSRISTYAYDAATGRAILTEHTGGLGHFDLAYAGAGASPTSTTMTDAAGNVKVASFSRIQGINRLVSVTSAVDGKSLTLAYDANGNVTSRTDEEGSTTTSSFDGANRVASTTQAFGTALARTTGITYADAVFNIPDTLTELSVRSGQSKTTVFVYGDTRFPKLPTSITVGGYKPDGSSVSRAVSLTYTAAAQVATTDGARTDVADTVSMTYWSCSTGGKCGQLATQTNALSQTTSFDAYDLAGRLTQQTEPNGTVTTFAYDGRGRLSSVTETPPAGAGSARVTGFTYDANSRIATSTTPDGVVLTHGYDIDGKLTSVQDPLGNRVEYGYDLKGNQTVETVKDGTSSIARQVTKAFDARNHLATVTAGTSITSLVHDAVGNLSSVVDPNGHQSTAQYDALHRPSRSVDALGGQGSTGYDATNQASSVGSPNGATWAFTHDDLGNELSEVGPDRGAVARTFDAAGNVLTSTDARGVTASYSWDALNRLTGISYPATGENVSLTWDSCTRGKGRLCGVTDSSGTWAYVYDGFGRVSSSTWTTGGVSFTTSYSWTPTDQIASITYPSGRVVAYTRDSLGRVAAVASAGSTLVSGRTYRADGLVSGQTFGNGLVDARTYDTLGKLSAWTLGSVDARTYGFDANGNITSITASGFGSTYGYDWLDRLISEPAQSFTYDPNGNRTTDGAGGYSYLANSNQLTVSPQGVVSLDAAGNTTSSSGLTFGFNQAGKLVTASSGGAPIGQYGYDYLQRRVSKLAGGSTTLFHYGLDGQLLAESTPAGAVIREYVNEGLAPLAQISGGVITYLHADHLGTPRIGTNSVKGVVWKWDGNAFGESTPSVQTVTVNRRFPGQFFDAETNLVQNWHRTYDPKHGRYLESDPIGVRGGVNTYGYVKGNPLSRTDPLGLRDVIVAIWTSQLALGSVGHVFVGEMNGSTITSQFPNPRNYLGVNQTLSWIDTVNAEKRQPDYVYEVNVPNNASFDTSAAAVRGAQNWFAIPALKSNSTNCSVAASGTLSAGGVKGLGSMSPAWPNWLNSSLYIQSLIGRQVTKLPSAPW
jgi:RHS repeat-associated protein